ncbi:hypothetical protein [Kitasatospora sp. NPDC088783]|uniref:hypothetical protein n=1 Tax=Kitasatospora sp. NPDC088783 TaxID=3364077 RepID=UPI0037F432D4
MDWAHAAGYGALGGLLIEAVTTFGHLIDWQEARRRARKAGRRKLPTITKFMDPIADALVAVSRVLLGAVVGWALHGQVVGAGAAIAAGASAPALLRQLATSHRVRDMIAGRSPEAGNADFAAALMSSVPTPSGQQPESRTEEKTS